MFYGEIFYHFVNKITRHGTIELKVQHCNTVRFILSGASPLFVPEIILAYPSVWGINHGQNTIFMTLTSQLVQ